MNEPEYIDNTTTDKRRKRQSKKIFLLFLITGITAIVLVGTTYAWFVGLGEVMVNTFDISIAAGKDIQISLDGFTWADNIAINENSIQQPLENGVGNTNGKAYSGSKNHWVGSEGLDPVSSSGVNVKGRLQFFSKTSLTATGGGYRLLADHIDNAYNKDESNKYVTFDIFIKNGTGETYNPAYNVLDDEAVYLTANSEVSGNAASGSGYGVQNSVRVAFVQIGRISVNSLVSGQTPEIKCEGDSPVVGTAASGTNKYSYTSLCDQTTNPYKTVIWEPNNTDHAVSLSTYYTTVCRKKSSTGTPAVISYDTTSTGACTALTDDAFKTYTVAKQIVAADNVDIYDGLNSYTANISSGSDAIGDKPLAQIPTFTDTMKDVKGTTRQEFMKLAPNSVTKIRVYVYLEGQDVDNYDLIARDTGISVGFGFTKAQLDMENPTES